KFQSTHPPLTGVTQAIDRHEARGIFALTRQPRVNERIAKIVRQTVRQQPRQSFVCFFVELRKGECSCTARGAFERHSQRGNIPPSLQKSFIEFKRGTAVPLIPCDGSCHDIPQRYPCDVNHFL